MEEESIMSRGQRKIKSIKIELEGKEKPWVWPSPDGEELPAAIFFDKKTAKKFLGPFYKKKHPKLKKTKALVKFWGEKIASAVFNGQNSVVIDDKVLDIALDTPDEDDLTLAMLRKTTGCPFG